MDAIVSIGEMFKLMIMFHIAAINNAIIGEIRMLKVKLLVIIIMYFSKSDIHGSPTIIPSSRS